MSNTQEIIQTNENTSDQVSDQVSEVKITENEIEDVSELNQIEKFFQVYYPDFRPPAWVAKMNPEFLDELLKCTKVYYNRKDNESSILENVKELIEKREPVNMTCWRGYNLKMLEELFGYTESPYSKFDHSVNLACLVKTPIRPFGNEMIIENSEHLTLTIAMLSLIAPAFDSVHQPDYYKFFRNNDCWLVEEIVKRYVLIFTIIFECAIREKMEVVYLAGYGLGAFNNVPADFADGFRIAYNKYAGKLQEIGIKLYFWDYNQTMYNKLTTMCPMMLNVEYAFVNNRELYSYVLKISQTIDISKVLFTNLWDMFSNLGNGNTGDNSWDGQWGRRTAISILALPQFNKYIEYINIDVDIEVPKIVIIDEAVTNEIVTNEVVNETATETVVTTVVETD